MKVEVFDKELGRTIEKIIDPSGKERFKSIYSSIYTWHDFYEVVIRNKGAKVKLHICGNLSPVLHHTAQTGADIMDLDYMVDMHRAAAVFPDTTCVCGNFDPVGILYHGTPESIRQAVLRCMDVPGRTMISPGCEIPRDTPAENVLAIHQTIRRSESEYFMEQMEKAVKN